MFTTLFASTLEFLLFVGALVLIYQVFLSDWLDLTKQKSKINKDKSSSVEKIAKIKLVSSDAKDIEKFVTDNADFLSNEIVGQLAARIESLHVDDFLASDDVLKKRIADLSQIEEEEVVNVKTVKS